MRISVHKIGFLMKRRLYDMNITIVNLAPYMENVSFTGGVAGFITRSLICLKKDLFGDDLFSRLEWLLD